MPVQDRAVRPDRDNCVVERRAAEGALALVQAAHDHELPFRCGVSHRSQAVGDEVHAVRHQRPMDLAGELEVSLRTKPPDPHGVTGHVRLREHHEVRAGVGGCMELRHRSHQRRFPFEQHWRALHHRNPRHPSSSLTLHPATIRRFRLAAAHRAGGHRRLERVLIGLRGTAGDLAGPEGRR